MMVFAAHGLFGTSCITALTVQSTLGVKALHPVEARILKETLDFLDEDLSPAGIKIGMLGGTETVEAVANYLGHIRSRHPRIPVVLDPVLVSSSGRELLSAEGVASLKSRLIPLIDWITPNAAELAVLSGRQVEKREDILTAARSVQHLYPALTVLTTGGDRNPPDDLLVLPDGGATWIPGEWVPTTSTHGTGCTLSSALLCRLVLGDSARNAAEAAKQYVFEALRSAEPIGHGRGPLNHLWPLAEPQRR
jgi:hydroxymethylpyrimidine/phosphomethylpyrimidine kinase